MNTHRSIRSITGFILITFLMLCGVTSAQGSTELPNKANASIGTAFTYQGLLKQNGYPVSGACDLQFSLWDSDINGHQVGLTQTKPNVTITNGFFTIPDLDFGTNAFDGNPRWIEISVRCPQGVGTYDTLKPRQPLTPTPYAIYADASANATSLGGVAASQYVLTTDPRLIDSRPPTAGSPNYIQNGSTVQASADFNISGNGVLGGTLTANKISIGTTNTSYQLTLNGQSSQVISMERNPASNSAGNPLTIQAGGATTGATDKPGGDLVLGAGVGTGRGGSGNVRIQTGGPTDSPGTGDDLLTDRIIVVSKPKAMTLASPGFTALISLHITGMNTAGGRIYYMIRATDGGSQIATETGVIQFLATANSITCTVQATDKLHLGTVNSGCTPGFFNPGSQPGVSVWDNVSFSSPAPIVVHEVYFRVENDSGAPVRLEP